MKQLMNFQKKAGNLVSKTLPKCGGNPRSKKQLTCLLRVIHILLITSRNGAWKKE